MLSWKTKWMGCALLACAAGVARAAKEMKIDYVRYYERSK